MFLSNRALAASVYAKRGIVGRAAGLSLASDAGWLGSLSSPGKWAILTGPNLTINRCGRTTRCQAAHRNSRLLLSD
jgi:hypothetical protein